jgi:hypothetical protein
MDSFNPQIMFQQDSEIHLGYLSYQPSTVETLEIDFAKVRSLFSILSFDRHHILKHYALGCDAVS